MTQTLLWLEDPLLSPEERWMLWQWSRRIGLDQCVTCSVSSLLSRLCMPVRKGQACLISLKDSRLIEVERSAPGGRGRPGYTYRIAPSLLDRLAESSPPSPLSSAIEAVGGCHTPKGDLAEQDPAVASPPVSADEHDVESAESGALPPHLVKAHARKATLTPANRWLLMVLLAHADGTGHVSNLSYSALEKLTGMGGGRLHSQLGKLNRLGLLVDHSPPHQRVGGRLASLWLLNLSHPALALRDRLVIEIVITTPRLSGERLPGATAFDNLAEALCVVAVSNRMELGKPGVKGVTRDDATVVENAKSLLPHGLAVGDLGRWLADHYEEGLTHWLQARLRAYALRLLSRWLADDKGHQLEAAGDPQQRLDTAEAVKRQADEALATDGMLEAAEHDVCSSACESEPRRDDEVPPTLTYVIHRLATNLARQLDALIQLDIHNADVTDLNSLILNLAPLKQWRPGAWILRGFAPHPSHETSPRRLQVTLPTVESDFAGWLRRCQQATAWFPDRYSSR